MKWCVNCKHYVNWWNDLDLIEICCKHKVRVKAKENLFCYGWELDDLHDNDAMDRKKQKDHKSLPDEE